ncbi:hypothetical protein [Fodinicola feengrottensis]|nr:hypothetical protein [Fodinicola feengrottensis]
MSLRSGRMVAWLRSWRTGLVPYDDVVSAVLGEDGEHEVADLPGAAHAVPLPYALKELSRISPDSIRLVMPVPGDPRGLPASSGLARAGLAVGEVVRCPEFGLIPEVTSRESGSGVQWETVVWRCHPIVFDPLNPLPLVDDFCTVGEAEMQLAQALLQTTDLLVDLDVARWRPELADALMDLRKAGRSHELPPGYSPRAERVLHRAELVAGIVDLAGEDDGGATSTQEANLRAQALRPLAAAARQARLAAYNSPIR